MKITAGILFYLLDRYDEMQHICHGADRMQLKRSEHFRNQKETEAGVLYIYADKKGVLLFCGEKKYKPSYILMKALKESKESFSSLWIPYGNLDEGERNSHLADEVSEYVSQIWNFFTQIQNEILESILSQESVEDIMGRVRGILRETFTIVDRDMLLLYQAPDMQKRLEETLGDNYAEEITEELLIAKEFHEVARKREPFYYTMQVLNQPMYCINIEVDGYYYARLVVYPEPEKDCLPSGAEQLSEYLAGVIVQMIRSGTLRVQRSQEDLLHKVCFDLAGGVRPEPSAMLQAIAAYRWNRTDTYQIMSLEPYSASGWETQIENTLPVMIRKLEQIRKNSCAVFSGKKILWVINRTLSGDAEKPQELSQELLLLLRENVLRAGVSSVFTDFLLSASALREAEAALVIGSKEDPSYWYYRFDDYRLRFMLQAISEKEIDTMLLVHPAIPVLLEHDKIHENELSKTLKTLLEKQGNMTQAAEALFIHRTTLFRRLNQIKELTGIDLDDKDLFLELQLSYRLMESREK